MLGSKIWFPAKTYGWGWGAPCAWQGWVVLLGYVGSMVGIALAINPDQQPVVFWTLLSFFTVLLLVICWLKGEPPAWRWGKRE